MAEYAVILGVIALAIVLALGVLSTAISGAITAVAGLM
jgi:Flp pilus assembly pilin Flp